MIITTEKEKEALIVAGKHLREVLDTLQEHLVPGVREMELNDIASQKILELGDRPSFYQHASAGESHPFPAVICVSVNDEVVHGLPSRQQLKDGDVVSVDCGLVHEGMFVDSAFTAVVGETTPEKERLLEATKKALAYALVVARAGMHIGDIGHTIENVATEHGYTIPVAFGGHGVGKAVHEQPFIPNIGDPGTGEELQEGLVIAVEPIFTESAVPTVVVGEDTFVYKTEDGTLAAHFEHTIIVTKGKPIILTGPMW